MSREPRLWSWAMLSHRMGWVAVCGLLLGVAGCGSSYRGDRPVSPDTTDREAKTDEAPPQTPTVPDETTAARHRFEPDVAGYRDVVRPFLTAHCVGCHGPDEQEGELRLDVLPNDFVDLAAKGRWSEVVNVLNGHEMPPKDEQQPDPTDVARVVDWITRQMARAELLRRDSAIVLRRLNRSEYRNTIRDLLGVDYDPIAFPEDSAAGGFDNNGAALTVSPLHLELYLAAAGDVLDLALVGGERPPVLKWRFQPESGDSDSNRVTYDGQRLIVNGGKNVVDGDAVTMHHASWDRTVQARDFRLPYEGEYVLRIRAGGVVPSREEVVASAERALQSRLERQMKENPKGERWHREAYDRDLEHFRSDRMYDYGPPRLKLIKNLGGQPQVVTEFDVDAPVDEPRVYEFRTRCSTEKAGLSIEYAYSVPKVLENFWFQGHDDFARPTARVDWFEIEGPVYDEWPPASRSRLLFDHPSKGDDETAYARAVLARFMRGAYRRPVTDDEIEAKLALFNAVRPNAESFEAALRAPLIAVLVSPHFLYLGEPNDPPADGTRPAARPLNDHELASRLSYFLWSTMPDETLSQLADAGALAKPDELAKQVRRMLADPRSGAFVQNFAGQWLGLREVGANPPAEDLYPRYDRHLETSIVEESEAFFAEILRHDLSAMNLVRSDFVVVDERLARFYGIPGVRGDHFRRVPVPEGVHRGGVVTQASVLTITSNGTRTSPVKRGTWVMKNLLGIDPGLPVANVGEIAPKVPGLDKATVRQRLEIHRQLPQCARCHDKIDPLGFALENFNAAGEWRDREGFGYKGRIGRDDPEIDASATLIDGTEFVGVDGLRDVLVEKRELFLRCLAGKLFTYALGRELGIADNLHVDAAVAHMERNGDTLPTLIEYIVTSEPFRTK